MLHRLNPPTDPVRNSLTALIERQRQLLEFSCGHTVCDKSTLQAALGDSFGDWVVRQRKVLEPLEILVTCLPEDKERVLSDFDHDQQFWEGIDNETFVFAFNPSSSEAHRHAKDCLNAFYDLLHATHPLLPDDLKPPKPRDIIQSYFVSNPFLQNVCPCCEGAWPEVLGKKSSPHTLEHFFHKEAHPTICLHPYNLIPVCGACNACRGNLEILRTASGTPIPINRIFHPLVRPARECVELQYYSTGLKPEQFKFVDLPTQLGEWREGVETFDRAYQIPKRWQERWTVIANVIESQIRSGLQAYKYSVQEPITEIKFEHIITGVIDALQEQPGRYQYPASRWLIWARQYNLKDLYRAFVIEQRSPLI